jgi:hypothetical protein
LQQLARRVFIDQGAVYIDQAHQQFKLATTREKEKIVIAGQKGKMTVCEVTVHSNSIFGQIFQYYTARDNAAFTTQQSPTTYLYRQIDIKDFSYLSIQ